MAKNKQNTQAIEESINTEVAVVETAFDAAAYIKECGGVSAAIRKLDAEGMKRGAIAKRLNKRYQHVRNVLTQPLKKPAATAEESAIANS